MTRRQRIWARILFGVYLAAVAFLCFGKFSSTKEVPMELWGIPTDNFPFPFFACLAFGGSLRKPWQAVLWTVIAFLSGCAFAAGTEWIQTKLPYRTGDPVDFQADALALLICSVIVLILVLVKKRK